MPKIKETISVEVEIEVEPLTDLEISMIRELLCDNESIWDQQDVFNALKEKFFDMKKVYVSYATE